MTTPTGISRRLLTLHQLARRAADTAELAYAAHDRDQQEDALPYLADIAEEQTRELYLLAQHLHKLGLLDHAAGWSSGSA
ncbi:hypothetical protein GON03_19445 [Nocardioides sp. MAH-18]|uniref:Uncharacterized protein n=1 Tax=Nocardioides agri TaxID=2682843 RepID=A0A6L6XVF9_9ACTN|nr:MULTISPECIES: hypothetical protein [unclassified Nocardioides]MBA2952195.1 hypothetical protein [Nocardioides sp. CGMCC 1.13656]MVQ51361.1 hypothetical protein [Nocardioides sp. MAH-18]